MVDFNKWRCRNCLHWHWTNFIKDAIRPCENSGCTCVNWESNDNLVYLEQKEKIRNE
jgi:hypothetical protein